MKFVYLYTVCTLPRAKNVKNKAKVNVLLSVEELTKQLKLARSKILALEKDLQALRGGTIVPPSEAEQGLDRDELIASNNELLDKLAEKVLICGLACSRGQFLTATLHSMSVWA